MRSWKSTASALKPTARCAVYKVGQTRPDQAYNMIMIQRNVSEAKAELSSLLVKVEEGEEVVIARNGKPVARIVAYEARREPRKLGSMRGQIWIADDFDAPGKDIEQMFYGGDDEVETAA